MTEREKLLETLKVAYEPRKIPQYDGSVALFYPTDEDVADMIEAVVIDEYKHRAEVAERALTNTCAILYAQGVEYPYSDEEWQLQQAKKELAEEGK